MGIHMSEQKATGICAVISTDYFQHHEFNTIKSAYYDISHSN